MSDTEASFLDLHLPISDDFVKTKIYDKLNDFGSDIMNFPFLDGDVPRSTLVILDMARCYLWLFTLYINIKIGKNSC